MKILLPEYSFMNRRLHEGITALGWDVVSFGSTNRFCRQLAAIMDRMTALFVPSHQHYPTCFVYQDQEPGQWENYVTALSNYMNNVCALEQPDAIFPTHRSDEWFGMMSVINANRDLPGIEFAAFRDFQNFTSMYHEFDISLITHPTMLQTIEWQTIPDSTGITFPVEAKLLHKLGDERVRILSSASEYDAFFSDYDRPKAFNGVKLATLRNPTGTDYMVQEHIVGDTLLVTGVVISGTPTIHGVIDVHYNTENNRYATGWSWPSRVINADTIASVAVADLFASTLTWPDGPFTIQLCIADGDTVYVIDATPRYDFFAGEVLANACEFTMEHAVSVLSAQHAISQPVVPLTPIYIGVLPIPTGVIGTINTPSWNSGIREVVVNSNPGDRVVHLVDSIQAYAAGYVVTSGSTAEEAEESYQEFIGGIVMNGA